VLTERPLQEAIERLWFDSERLQEERDALAWQPILNHAATTTRGADR
jgi:hypothetical protein